MVLDSCLLPVAANQSLCSMDFACLFESDLGLSLAALNNQVEYVIIIKKEHKKAKIYLISSVKILFHFDP